MNEPYDIEIPEVKKPDEFTISNNYIVIPTINIELRNDLLLRFYKDNNIEIKFRLHSKNEYEFNGKIIKMYGSEEKDKEDEEEEKQDDIELEELKKEQGESYSPCSVGFIPQRGYISFWWYIILEDNNNNKIKLFLDDIDHRTIMPKDVNVITPIQLFQREYIPQKLRFETLEKCSYTCQYCGRKSPEVELQIDHIIPVSKGGQTIANNLTVSCRDCNIGKSDKILNNIK